MGLLLGNMGIFGFLCTEISTYTGPKTSVLRTEFDQTVRTGSTLGPDQKVGLGRNPYFQPFYSSYLG